MRLGKNKWAEKTQTNLLLGKQYYEYVGTAEITVFC